MPPKGNCIPVESGKQRLALTAITSFRCKWDDASRATADCRNAAQSSDQVCMTPKIMAELPVDLRQSAVEVLQIADSLPQQPSESDQCRIIERTAPFGFLVPQARLRQLRHLIGC